MLFHLKMQCLTLSSCFSAHYISSVSSCILYLVIKFLQFSVFILSTPHFSFYINRLEQLKMVMRLITAVVYWQRKVKRGGDNEPRPSAEKKQHQLY